MKRFMIFASLFVMAAAVVSCEKNENAFAVEESGVQVLVTTPTDTRAIVEPNGTGYYSVKWSTVAGAEKVRIMYANPTGNAGNTKDALITVSADGTSGTIWLTNGKTPGETQAWVIYPSDASGDTGLSVPFSAVNKLIYIGLAATQNCEMDAPDPTQTLMFTNIAYESAEGATTQTSFNHIVAYGKLSFKGLNGNKIESVTFTASDAEALAAKICNYNIETGEWSPYESDAELSKSITVKCPDGGIDSNGNIWFASIPSAEAYHNFTIDVTIDGTTYTKTFTSEQGIQFNCGRVRPINVDMTGATAK